MSAAPDRRPWVGADRRVSPEFGRRAADDPDIYMRYLLGEQDIAKHLAKSIGGLRAAADMLDKLDRPIGAKALRKIADEAFAVLEKTTASAS